MRKLSLCLPVVFLGAALSPSSAAAQLATYEDWKTPTIRGDRWTNTDLSDHEPGTDVSRLVTAKKLDLELRAGARGIEPPVRVFNGLRLRRGDLPFTNPSAVSSLEVTFGGVTDKLTKQCTASSPGAPSQVGSLLLLQTFNDGASTGPADQTGDYALLIGAIHGTDDPATRVYAFVVRCNEPPCDDFDDVSTNFPDGALLGTVKKGASFKLSAAWDAGNDAFVAGLGNTMLSMEYDGAVPVNPAVRPTALVGVDAYPGSCIVGDRTAQIAAKIGLVRTNPEAVIP
jgi:hypothetical protein